MRVFTPGSLGDLSVVGGGVIGLTCALAALDRGWRVTIFDAGRESRASDVAGGMLGCFAEGWSGEDRLLEISRESVTRWPALIDRIGDPQIRVAADTIMLGATPADVEHLTAQIRFVLSARPEDADCLQTLTPPQVRAAEPALRRGVAGGFRAIGEGAVDNRRLIAGLHRALDEGGAVRIDSRIDDLADVPGDQIVVAAGAATGRLLPDIDVRGEKGEILRLRRTRFSVPPPTHVVRARWHGRAVYLVPRQDGLVLGATQYEAFDDADRRPLAGGVADLLADAQEMMPSLRTYELVEVGAGIRPSSVDGLPIVERIDASVVVAAGHGRNGIALAPWTAHAVADLLDTCFESPSSLTDTRHEARSTPWN